MVKIKICGLTRKEDLARAIALGADYLGLVFYRGSKRYLGFEKADEMLKCGRGHSKIVGVFVDASLEVVKKYYHELSLDAVQLHGNESPEYCQKLELPYWKALRPKTEGEIGKLQYYDTAQAWLLDSYSSETYGGSGHPLSINILCNKQTIFKPLVLAGGICVDNLEKYWKQNPWGIDISSGVETSPGIKCAVKMEKLFNRVKELREKNESK